MLGLRFAKLSWFERFLHLFTLALRLISNTIRPRAATRP